MNTFNTLIVTLLLVSLVSAIGTSSGTSDNGFGQYVVIPNGHLYSDYSQANQALFDQYYSQYLGPDYIPLAPDADGSSDSTSTPPIYASSGNGFAIPMDKLKPPLGFVDTSYPKILDLLHDENGDLYAVIYQNVQKTVSDAMSYNQKYVHWFQITAVAVSDDDGETWKYLGEQGQIPNPDGNVWFDKSKGITETAHVGSHFVGAAPAPGGGVYVFYTTHEDRYRSSQGGYPYFYQRLKQVSELRVMAVTKDHPPTDILIASNFDGVSHNLLFLGAMNDQYYYCKSTWNMAYSDDYCSDSDVDSKLYVSSGLGGPLKEIGNLNLPKSSSYSNIYNGHTDHLILHPQGGLFAKRTGDDPALYSNSGGAWHAQASLTESPLRYPLDAPWVGYARGYSDSYTFDSQGNMHTAYYVIQGSYGMSSTVKLYYRMIPIHVLNGTAAPSNTVNVFTTADCPDCVLLKTFLAQSGVAFKETVKDQKVDASVKKSEYPFAVIVDSTGQSNTVTGFDKQRLIQLLELSVDPILVGTYDLPATYYGDYSNVLPHLYPSIYLSGDETPQILAEDKTLTILKFYPLRSDWKQKS